MVVNPDVAQLTARIKLDPSDLEVMKKEIKKTMSVGLQDAFKSAGSMASDKSGGRQDKSSQGIFDMVGLLKKIAGPVALMAILMKGFTPVLKTLEVISHLLSMMVLPFAKILMPLLIPLIYLLTPMAKMLNAVLAPYHKEMMEMAMQAKDNPLLAAGMGVAGIGAFVLGLKGIGAAVTAATSAIGVSAGAGVAGTGLLGTLGTLAVGVAGATAAIYSGAKLVEGAKTLLEGGDINEWAKRIEEEITNVPIVGDVAKVVLDAERNIIDDAGRRGAEIGSALRSITDWLGLTPPGVNLFEPPTNYIDNTGTRQPDITQRPGGVVIRDASGTKIKVGQEEVSSTNIGPYTTLPGTAEFSLMHPTPTGAGSYSMLNEQGQVIGEYIAQQKEATQTIKTLEDVFNEKGIPAVTEFGGKIYKTSDLLEYVHTYFQKIGESAGDLDTNFIQLQNNLVNFANALDMAKDFHPTGTDVWGALGGSVANRALEQAVSSEKSPYRIWADSLGQSDYQYYQTSTGTQYRIDPNTGGKIYSDFIQRPGQPATQFSADDTIIGVKDSSSLGGNVNVTLNIPQSVVLNDQARREIVSLVDRRLAEMIRSVS